MSSPIVLVAQDFREDRGQWPSSIGATTTTMDRGYYVVAPSRTLIPAPTSWSAVNTAIEMQFRLEAGSAGIFCGMPGAGGTGYLMSIDDSAGYALERLDHGASRTLDSGVMPEGARSDLGEPLLLRLVCDAVGQVFVTLNGSPWQRVVDPEPLPLTALRPAISVEGSARIEGVAILGDAQ